MTQHQKVLAVLVVALVGIWGCAQGPAGGASAEKIKNLEAKVTRLEDDLKATATSRDQARKKLAETEKERDDLQTQVCVRTAERDALTNHFESFRKGLKDLLGQTEAALGKPAAP